jgi:hypothetical protein
VEGRGQWEKVIIREWEKGKRGYSQRKGSESDWERRCERGREGEW